MNLAGSRKLWGDLPLDKAAVGHLASWLTDSDTSGNDMAMAWPSGIGDAFGNRMWAVCKLAVHSCISRCRAGANGMETMREQCCMYASGLGSILQMRWNRGDWNGHLFGISVRLEAYLFSLFYT